MELVISLLKNEIVKIRTNYYMLHDHLDPHSTFYQLLGGVKGRRKAGWRFLQEGEVLTDDGGGQTGGFSASQPPEAKGLKIGEIPINLAESQIQGIGGKGRNLGQCMPKATLFPSMIVRSSKIKD